jgi:hypothetical protein
MCVGYELERTIVEYHDTLTEILQCREMKENLRWKLVQRRLSKISGWSTEGAEEVIRLAREYGGFMLRNALAIAKVFNIEDGELGF